jgi:hypothetical protein
MANARSTSRIAGLSVRAPHELQRAKPIGHDHDERGILGTGEPAPKATDRFRVLGLPAGKLRGLRDWRWVAHTRTKAEAMAIGRSLSTMEWSRWRHEPLGHVGQEGREPGPVSKKLTLRALRLRVFGVLEALGRPIPENLGLLGREHLETLLKQALKPSPVVRQPRNAGKRMSKKAKRALRGLPSGRKPIR